MQGNVAPALLFNAGLYDPEKKSPDVQAWLKAEAYAAADHDHGGDHHHHHAPDHEHGQAHDVNRHDEAIRAFCLTYDKPLDWERFNSWIEMLITLGESLITSSTFTSQQGILSCIHATW